ncbi:MAG: APC family permease [Planctomycetota bacterium]|jgi:APA family basic amino acid/polyamine antiporter
MGDQNDSTLLRRVRLRSATALVVANIIGAGIFTTTGFQAADLGHPGFIFALWIVGGVLALCGALCYAELGAAMPRAGGEYVYLRETYGAWLGFMSAFVSLTAGFSAPVAAASKALVRYLAHFFPALANEPTIAGFVTVNDLLAIGVVWLLVAIHLRGMRGGVGFNDLITLFKVVGILAIILGAAAFGQGRVEHFAEVTPAFRDLQGAERMAAFGTSLIFVMFCYSGWNASAYIAGEMRDPQRDLPRSLMVGTAIVLALYLGLNAVYFYGASASELAGKAEVGLVASQRLFGEVGVTLVTIVLCVSILASASAMTIAGPRVSFAMGRDLLRFRVLSRVGRGTGAPVPALLLQGAVTTIIILSGAIDEIQQYAGFTLSLFASLAVSCVLVLRVTRPKMPRPFRTWGYPFTPLLFLAISGWMMFWSVRGRPTESILGMATVAIGGILFLLLGKKRIHHRGTEDTEEH